MKIILFSRREVAHVEAELRLIRDAVRRHGFSWCVNKEFAAIVARATGEAPDAIPVYDGETGDQPADAVMVCYGGDGTLLEGIRRLGGRPIPVVGINSGHMGFLAGAPQTRIGELFDDLAAGRIRFEERTALEVEGPFGVLRAVNEVAVQRNGAGMIAVETYVDGQMVATYHGDGLILATPTGSTAYSLSAGGPVVVPRCRCLVLSPLAPHNLTMRPVVVPDDCTVRLRIRDRRSSGVTLSLDSTAHEVPDGTELVVRRAANPIRLGTAHNISFYDTLRDKMMWGVDIRG